MIRSTRNARPAPSRRRIVPPLPHPSWSEGSDYARASASALQPEDFWQRLGL